MANKFNKFPNNPISLIVFFPGQHQLKIADPFVLSPSEEESFQQHKLGISGMTMLDKVCFPRRVGITEICSPHCYLIPQFALGKLDWAAM